MREDDTEDFPLSKRITQLKINSELTQPLNDPMRARNHSYHQQINHNTSSLPEYCPDLNLYENPHYYQTNKVLYDLFNERQMRKELHRNNS